MLWAGCAALQLAGTGWLLMHIKDLQSAREGTAEALAARESLRSQRDALQGEVAGLTVQRDSLATSQAILEQAMVKARTAQEQEALANANAASLTKQITTLENRRAELGEAVASNSSTLEQLNTKIESLRPEAQQLDKAAKELKAITEQIATAGSAARKGRLEASALAVDAKTLADQIDSDTKRKVDLQRQLVAMRTELEEAVAQRAQLAGLAEQHAKAQEQASKAILALKSAQDEQDKAVAALRERRTSLAELNAQAEERTRELQRLEDRRIWVTKEVATLTMSREELVAATAAGKAEMAAFEGKRTTATAAEARRLTLLADTDALARRQSELAGAISALLIERDGLAKVIGALRTQQAQSKESPAP